MGQLIYALDLSGDMLADDGLTWLHTMPIGEKTHPVYGKLNFSKSRLQRFADNIKKNVRKIALDVDYNHKQDPSKGAKAAGWIKDAEVREDGLWVGVQFNDTAKQEIKAGEWKYFSPEFVDEWTDADGNTFKDVLLGAALTNRPFLKDLMPIAASESYVDSFRPETPPSEGAGVELALLALAALGQRSAKLADYSGTPNYYDRNFASDMLMHHNRAIEMSAQLLQRGSLPALKEMANRIIESQSKEVARLIEWVKSWGSSSNGEEGM